MFQQSRFLYRNFKKICPENRYICGIPRVLTKFSKIKCIKAMQSWYPKMLQYLQILWLLFIFYDLLCNLHLCAQAFACILISGPMELHDTRITVFIISKRCSLVPSRNVRCAYVLFLFLFAAFVACSNVYTLTRYFSEAILGSNLVLP